MFKCSESKYLGEMRISIGVIRSNPRKDSEIESMTSLERLKLICFYEFGNEKFAEDFISWAKDVGMLIVE